MPRRLTAALCAFALIAAPAAAQPPEDPDPAEQPERRGLEGELIGYLAVPALLVLVLLAGLLVGGGDERPESP